MVAHLPPVPTQPNPEGIIMATNRKPLLDAPFTAWVATLSTVPSGASLLWCDECHHWHASTSECPYSPKAGA
jgi:hypothetical protein